MVASRPVSFTRELFASFGLGAALDEAFGAAAGEGFFGRRCEKSANVLA